MIFIALGTQKFQCNRLLMEMDKLIREGKITEEVFAQIGQSDYVPENYKYVNFVEKDKFNQMIQNCSLLITHSGVGTIISGIDKKKRIIVFPRLSKYGEHVDDHQLQIARAFSDAGHVLICTEAGDLYNEILRSENFNFTRYISHRDNVIKVLNNFLDNVR